MNFFDGHTHIQFPIYDSDRDEVIKRARAAGLCKMIVVGTQGKTSKDAIRLSEQYPDLIWATVGFHPNHLDEKPHHDKAEQVDLAREEFSFERFLELAKNPRVVAIGECGLDFYRSKKEELRSKQEPVFRKHIELALEVGKPLMIHCREAFQDLIDVLVACRISLLPNPGVIHFFTGTTDDARKLLELGFTFTFGGVVTFTRDYDEVIKLIPLDRILSETDAPYVSPAPYRGRRNEPAYVVETVKKLAELKGVSLEKMSEQILENAGRIFGI